ILRGELPPNPYEATSAVASILRKEPAFRELLAHKMALGSEWVKDLGNLYSAALPAWLAAGLEEAVTRKVALTGEPMVAVGYGSGDAAEAIPVRTVDNWERAAERIGFREALSDPIDLNQ